MLYNSRKLLTVNMVPREGLEPSHLSIPDPKYCYWLLMNKVLRN